MWNKFLVFSLVIVCLMCLKLENRLFRWCEMVVSSALNGVEFIDRTERKRGKSHFRNHFRKKQCYFSSSRKKDNSNTTREAIIFYLRGNVFVWGWLIVSNENGVVDAIQMIIFSHKIVHVNDILISDHFNGMDLTRYRNDFGWKYLFGIFNI